MFQKERYKVHLCGVEIFPQGLAAVHNQGAMPGMNMLVDIGNGTMSILEIHDETVIPNPILFSPTIKFKQDNSSKKMRKEMILRGLSEDETFSKICENEDVKRLMEKLSSEV